MRGAFRVRFAAGREETSATVVPEGGADDVCGPPRCSMQSMDRTVSCENANTRRCHAVSVSMVRMARL